MSLRQRMTRDDGTTLVELMVGISLMAVFMSMFTGSILMLNKAMNTTQAVAFSSAQVNVAFGSLDRMVRYAVAISNPGVGTTTGDWYVELRTTNTGSEVCTQLRVDIVTQQLQKRTWQVTNNVALSLTAWIPVASGITNGSVPSGPTSQPFYLPTPKSNSLFQQLTVNIVAQAGSASSVVDSVSSFTLTAMNSSLPPPGAICQQQGRP